MRAKENKDGKSPANSSAPETIEADRLERAIRWCFPNNIFSDLKLHGNVSWSVYIDVFIGLVVLTAWGQSARMTDSFADACHLSLKLFDRVVVATYQGMMRALVRYSPQLIVIVWARFQTLMSEASPDQFRICGWVPLACDGSRFSTPRTESNERAFAAKNYGKGKTAKSRRKWKNKNKRSRKLATPIKPQIWLTLVWHMALKLPWCWKTGPSNSSERDHLVDMIKSMKFPEKTLFCCDAGFTGYEFWKSLLEAGHHFVIRVGGNVRLLKGLAHTRHKNGLVYLWPSEAIRKKQQPMVLRLIEVKGEKGTMYLVTSVLSPRELSLTMLKAIYPLRWGIELQFRTAKQTFELGILRSRNSDHALVELNWSMVALTAVQLLALKEQSKFDVPPEISSAGEALRAIRSSMRHWYENKPDGHTLTTRLRDAVVDTYDRKSSKTARYRPNYKDKPTTSQPIITEATEMQKQIFNELKLAC